MAGITWRSAVLVWVTLSVAAMVLGTIVGFWGELFGEPSGPGAEAMADPGFVDAAGVGVIVGVFATVVGQVLIVPLALVAGTVAGGWAVRRRSASPAGP